MIVSDFNINGLKVIIPNVFDDNRGYFLESYRNDTYTSVLGVTFVQDNMSYSRYGTIRGLHYQREPHMQAKLVRCAHGEILDIALDIREYSPTYGKHASLILSAANQKQFFIPEGFAHGFAVLSKEAVVEYKCNSYYHPDSDAGILYNDEQLGINWMIPTNERILSDKDLSLVRFGCINRS